MQRRVFLLQTAAVVHTLSAVSRPTWGDDEADATTSRIRGMLLGSLIGDAAGGPIEFKPPGEVEQWMPATRQWADDKRLSASEIRRLGRSFRLLPYDELRPDPAPYAHWTAKAAPGTVTDDSRHKFMLLAALRQAEANDSFPISQAHLAQQYLDYQQLPIFERRPEYRELCEQWLREYHQAARWVVGDRNLERAAPVERLWGGVATNAGQMALLPLAAVFAGSPDAAYQASFQLGFIDNGPAKDLNSAIVAGLASALAQPGNQPEKQRWQQLRAVMTEIDPYRFAQIPWVTRPTTRWLDFATRSAERADRSPKKLFEILEQEGQPHYHWDAHFVLASSWAILALCDFAPLASMQLALDFGHDTDSTAQLVGAFVGAMYGEEIFPPEMRQQVLRRLTDDYDESVDEWTALLIKLRDRKQYPVIVA